MKNTSGTEQILSGSLGSLTFDKKSPVKLELGQLAWLLRRINDLEELDDLNETIHSRDWEKINDLKKRNELLEQTNAMFRDFCHKPENETAFLAYMDECAGKKEE